MQRCRIWWCSQASYRMPICANWSTNHPNCSNRAPFDFWLNTLLSITLPNNIYYACFYSTYFRPLLSTSQFISIESCIMSLITAISNKQKALLFIPRILLLFIIVYLLSAIAPNTIFTFSVSVAIKNEKCNNNFFLKKRFKTNHK